MKKIAPLLKNGEIRVRLHGRLPNAVKEGLRAIARSEKKSMSWVVEEVLIDYFSLPRPKYKKEKERTSNQKPRIYENMVH